MNSNNLVKPCHADMMIKICGMRQPANIAQVASLSHMAMGFIFHEPSPRDASKTVTPDIIAHLPAYVHPVAVTVNKSVEENIDICHKFGFKIIQLHGSESPGECEELSHAGLRVFKAVGVGDNLPLKTLETYIGKVDLFLFDNRCDTHGGSGQKFDWALLDHYDLPVPYLLSGGIGPDDVRVICNSLRPGMAGIDINSKFESSPGVKDLHHLINFILTLRTYNEHEPSPIPVWEKKY